MHGGMHRPMAQRGRPSPIYRQDPGADIVIKEEDMQGVTVVGFMAYQISIYVYCIMYYSIMITYTGQ